MQGERVVFTFEARPNQYVKLVVSGAVDEYLLGALKDFVERQRMGDTRTKGIRRQLDKALANVTAEIQGHAQHGGRYAGPLSAEGYAGGYRDALRDVKCALSGMANDNSRFWPPPTIRKRRKGDD